jgi:hypothetical protein
MKPQVQPFLQQQPMHSSRNSVSAFMQWQRPYFQLQISRDDLEFQHISCTLTARDEFAL